MQRAVQTFHHFTTSGVRTIAAGAELADDDPAVKDAPQYFVLVEPPPETAPVKPVRRTSARGKSTR